MKPDAFFHLLMQRTVRETVVSICTCAHWISIETCHHSKHMLDAFRQRSPTQHRPNGIANKPLKRAPNRQTNILLRGGRQNTKGNFIFMITARNTIPCISYSNEYSNTMRTPKSAPLSLVHSCSKHILPCSSRRCCELVVCLLHAIFFAFCFCCSVRNATENLGGHQGNCIIHSVRVLWTSLSVAVNRMFNCARKCAFRRGAVRLAGGKACRNYAFKTRMSLWLVYGTSRHKVSINCKHFAKDFFL